MVRRFLSEIAFECRSPLSKISRALLEADYCYWNPRRMGWADRTENFTCILPYIPIMCSQLISCAYNGPRFTPNYGGKLRKKNVFIAIVIKKLYPLIDRTCCLHFFQLIRFGQRQYTWTQSLYHELKAVGRSWSTFKSQRGKDLDGRKYCRPFAPPCATGHNHDHVLGARELNSLSFQTPASWCKESPH